MGSSPARTDSDPRRQALRVATGADPAASALDLDQRPRRDAAPEGGDERYRAIFDHLPLMAFRLDRHGTVRSVNEYGARELGYARGELVGRSVLEVFHPEDRPAAGRQLSWALESAGEIARSELRKVRKDGTVLWVRETMCMVQGSKGKPEVLVVCEDVSERRRVVRRLGRARDQLRELNAELLRAEAREGRRIAGVLHDEVGQTLVAARMRLCELLVSEGSTVETERLRELRDLVDRAIEVTRSLTFQLSPPILHDLGLAAALQALGERVAKDHGLRFTFESGDGWSPPAEDAGVVLYRVLRELFHNVTKHARARGVRLELDGDGERIRIVLEDDGAGFDAAASAGGHSLGLFQVRERMVRLGGCFEIDSSPGRGTRARLTLPLGGGAQRRRRDRGQSP